MCTTMKNIFLGFTSTGLAQEAGMVTTWHFWLTTLSYPNVKISTVMLLYWFDWRENLWDPLGSTILFRSSRPCWWPYLGVVIPVWTRQPARLTTCSCPSRNERLGIVWVNSRDNTSNSPIPHLSTAGLGAAEITGFKVWIGNLFDPLAEFDKELS